MRGRVQNKDMTPLNGHLHARDEEDTPVLSVGSQVMVERHLVMIGDGNHVKILIGSLGDKLFGCVSNAVEGIFSRVKMQIGLQGSRSFRLENRFLQNFLFLREHFNRSSIYKILHGSCQIPGKLVKESGLRD